MSATAGRPTAASFTRATNAGADTWQALTSVLRTAVQQDRDPIELLAHLLRAPDPIVADLVIPGH